MHNFKSHFWWDFLAYCTRPASVHLVMAFIGCSFDSFSIFLLSLKQQQNLMKIKFSCIHFPVWPYPPQIMKKLYFILVNCMGKHTHNGLTGMYDHNQKWIIAFKWPADGSSYVSPISHSAQHFLIPKHFLGGSIFKHGSQGLGLEPNKDLQGPILDFVRTIATVRNTKNLLFVQLIFQEPLLVCSPLASGLGTNTFSASLLLAQVLAQFEF